MPLEGQAKKDYQKKYMKDKRSNTQGLTNSGSNAEGSNIRDGLIFPPSKFLSPEQDMIVQENVINALKAMSGSRKQAFRAMSNIFIPNVIRDPTLNRPEL